MEDWTARPSPSIASGSISSASSLPQATASITNTKAKISRLTNAQNQMNPNHISNSSTFTADAGVAVADAIAQSQLANMTFNPMMIKNQLKQANLVELYKNAPTKKRGQLPLGMIADPVSFI